MRAKRTTKAGRQRRQAFNDGILAAAHHLDYSGYDRLADEVLRLQCLTRADLERWRKL